MYCVAETGRDGWDFIQTGCMSMSKDMKHGREATLTLGEALAGPGAVHGSTWFMVQVDDGDYVFMYCIV